MFATEICEKISIDREKTEHANAPNTVHFGDNAG